MSRNKPVSATRLVAAFLSELQDIVPGTWTVEWTAEPDGRRDLVVRLEAPDGGRVVIDAEVKRVVELEPRRLREAITWLRDRRGGSATFDPGASRALVFLAPYLSPRSRQILAREGVGWFDATGNCCLKADRPALLIQRTGADRNPFPDPAGNRRRSLRGAGAARVVRYLLDNPAEGVGVRQLAGEAGVSPTTAFRVLDLLGRDDLVRRTSSGAVEAVAKSALVRHWTEDYGLTTSNRAVKVLAPRGLDWLRGQLDRLDTYAVTGSAAARVHLPDSELSVSPEVLLAVFAPDADVAMDVLGVREVARGANALLVESFDEVVYRGAVTLESVRYVAASQAVADLLTGPARWPEEGQQLIDVLGREDPGWIT